MNAGAYSRGTTKTCGLNPGGGASEIPGGGGIGWTPMVAHDQGVGIVRTTSSGMIACSAGIGGVSPLKRAGSKLQSA